MASETIVTPLTKFLGIKHPILLAGMNVAAGPDLAAAVTNAGEYFAISCPISSSFVDYTPAFFFCFSGGLGVIGGVGYTPAMLREQIQELKEALDDKTAPFGVDLLLPKVGGNARKTNKDYTKGTIWNWC